MTVLVTGAAGFIGYHTARALMAQGESVLGIDNLTPCSVPSLKSYRIEGLEREFPHSFRLIQTDLADGSALARVLDGFDFDSIVHLAARAGVRDSASDPQGYIRSNLLGHFNLLELARERRPKHLVYASSSSVYGARGQLPSSEEHRTDWPASLYAASKKSDELMSEYYASHFTLPMTGLRFFTVYGPCGRPDMAVWLFTEAILAGKPVYLHNKGSMRRDFTYVDDVLCAILACLNAPPTDDGKGKPGGSRAPHAIYNVGNSRPVELQRLIEVIEEAVGKKAIIRFTDRAAGEALETYADISALRRDFGYEPRTSVESGVPRFARWYEEFRARSLLLPA